MASISWRCLASWPQGRTIGLSAPLAILTTGSALALAVHEPVPCSTLVTGPLSRVRRAKEKRVRAEPGEGGVEIFLPSRGADAFMPPWLYTVDKPPPSKPSRA